MKGFLIWLAAALSLYFFPNGIVLGGVLLTAIGYIYNFFDEHGYGEYFALYSGLIIVIWFIWNVVFGNG